jgi:integrase
VNKLKLRSTPVHPNEAVFLCALDAFAQARANRIRRSVVVLYQPTPSRRHELFFFKPEVVALPRTIQQDYIRPAGQKLGLDDIGWHTFRHTDRSWLELADTSMGVQQKLIRHAQIATTMKRIANSKVVQMVLRPALREAK